MIPVYILCSVTSLVILILYGLITTRQDTNTLIILTIIFISNIGYLSLATAQTVEMAILALKLSYVSGVFLPVLTFHCVSEICNIKIDKRITGVMFALQTVLMVIISGIGYNNLYYTSYQLHQINGVSYLTKTYGPFHAVYYATLVVYLACGLVVTIMSFARKKKVDVKNIYFFFLIYGLCVGSSVLERLLNFPYEIVPITNTFVFSLLLIPVQRTMRLYNIHATVYDVIEHDNSISYIAFNKKLKYLGCNDIAKTLFPETEDFAINKTIPESSGILYSQILPQLKRFQTTGTYEPIHFNLGEKIWDLKLKPIIEKNSSTAGYLAELTDATERLRQMNLIEKYNKRLQVEISDKEKLLREMQNHLTMGFDHSDTAYCIIKVELDENNRPFDWRFVYLNDALARLEGIPKEQMLNKKFFDIFPAGDKKWLNYYYPAAFENKSFVFEELSEEIGIYLKVQCFPVDKGYCGCILEDARSSREMQRNTADLEMIYGALCSDYLNLYVVDMDTGIGHSYTKNLLFVSSKDDQFNEGLYEELIQNYIEKEHVFQSDTVLFEPICSFDGLRTLMAKKPHYVFNYRTYYFDQQQYMQIHFARMSDNEKDYCIIASRNINEQVAKELEQKQLIEEALRRAESASQSKTAFLSNMSHDIRTPMNAIIGFTELASANAGNKEKTLDYLGKISSSSNHLLSLINDVLDMSRIESGKVSLEENECNLIELTEELKNILMADMNAKNHSFTIDTDDITNEKVFCDKLRLNQVLINILGNSVKFTEPGGKINLTIVEKIDPRKNYGSYEFRITDTGIGMSSKFITHIFEPFERERTSTVSKTQGTGLGMAITKNLVDMMEGKIEVESEIGKGSEFTVKIPLRHNATDEIEELDDAETAENVPEKKNPASDNNFEGKRILLVEDNELNREIPNTLLSRAALKVEEAENGQLAVETLVKQGAGHFDMILMDVQMPVMNGYQATQAIRALDDKALNSIPIIAMTADAFDEDKKKAFEAGMDGHLTKPINVKLLFETLKEILSSE